MSEGLSHVHITPPKTYVLIWVILMALLLVTVGIAFWDLSKFVPIPGINLIVAMCIAFVKMTLVMLYFMHVKWSGKLTWLFAALGFVFLIILFIFTYADYLTRGMHPVTGWN